MSNKPVILQNQRNRSSLRRFRKQIHQKKNESSRSVFTADFSEFEELKNNADREYGEAIRERVLNPLHDGMWGGIAGQYNQAVKKLDEICEQANRQRQDVRDEIKDEAIRCWINRTHCTLLINATGAPGVLDYDNARSIKKEISTLEQEIKQYRCDKFLTWNRLQRAYDQWGEERRAIGMKYEADELQYFMLKARLKRKFWAHFPRLASVLSSTLNFPSKIARLIWNHIPEMLKHLIVWLGHAIELLRALAEWSLYFFGKGLFGPFIVFVIGPIIIYSALYAQHLDCIVLDGRCELLNGAQRFGYSLYLSVFVFTGEPGVVEICHPTPMFRFLMASEAIFALIFMLFVIGYLVNRLSSR